MEKLFLFFVLLFISLLSGCSDNSSIVQVYDLPCNEEEILSQPGSSDAPILYLDKEDESTNMYLCWTYFTDSYYEVEESGNACFNSFIYHYTVNDNTYSKIKNDYFYRVRAITPGGITGWSNIVIGSQVGIL
jgi:hypothetical protein